MSHQLWIVVIGEPADAGLRDSLVSASRTCGCLVDVLDWGPWSPAWLVSAAPPRVSTVLEGHTYADRADQVLTELSIS